jgi:hypothetical protein
VEISADGVSFADYPLTVTVPVLSSNKDLSVFTVDGVTVGVTVGVGVLVWVGVGLGEAFGVIVGVGVVVGVIVGVGLGHEGQLPESSQPAVSTYEKVGLVSMYTVSPVNPVVAVAHPT